MIMLRYNHLADPPEHRFLFVMACGSEGQRWDARSRSWRSARAVMSSRLSHLDRRSSVLECDRY
jgi:hypothetical protein